MLLLIDNYDSFTYNLAQIFGELGADVVVKRNDESRRWRTFETLRPARICISPGPGPAARRGNQLRCHSRIWRRKFRCSAFASVTNALAKSYGGEIVRAPKLMHGKTSAISHHRDRCF